MDTIYKPQEVEEQPQQYWQKKQSFNVTEDLNKENFYCLSNVSYSKITYKKKKIF